METTPDILCIGAVLWDIVGRSDRAMAAGMDVPGRISRVPGGVALNIAMTLTRLGMRPALLTAIGDDEEGDALIAACTGPGLDCRYLHRQADHPTDRYMAIEDANGLIAAIADAHGLEAAGAAILAPLADGRLGSAGRPWAGLVALDGNLTEALLASIAASPLFAAADLRIAPASPGKALRVAPLLGLPNATLYANLAEASLLADETFADAATAAKRLIAQGAARVIVTDGGSLVADGAAASDIIIAVPPRVTVARVTGAGDTLMAAHLMAERQGADRRTALDRAVTTAAAFVSGTDA
jgi:sugar/nucleoside kinase (ribokinase family)